MTPPSWLAVTLTCLATVAINALIFAYGYGALTHRVQSLEEQRAEMRAEWLAARERIENALKELKR